MSEPSAVVSIEERKAIRRANVGLLLDRHGQTRLADMTGIAPAMLYQFGRAQGKSKRNISDRKAREIEQALGLSAGWLDVDRQALPAGDSAPSGGKDRGQAVASWPFERISPDDFFGLSAAQRTEIEDIVEDRVARFRVRNDARGRPKSRELRKVRAP